MKTFDEVLEKHKKNARNHKKSNSCGYWFLQSEGDGNTITVCKSIATNCEECYVFEDTVKSFTSPEKLDQFLTLLFEE